jgi:hypothetical protein
MHILYLTFCKLQRQAGYFVHAHNPSNWEAEGEGLPTGLHKTSDNHTRFSVFDVNVDGGHLCWETEKSIWKSSKENGPSWTI